MRLRLVVPSGLVALLGGAAPLAAQSFEGTIVTQLFDGGKPRSEMVSSYKGNRTRVDLPGKEGKTYMLMNGATGVWQTVMPPQKMYMTMDLKSMADKVDQGKKPKGADKREAAPRLTRTGKTETIAGHQCEHFTMPSDEPGELSDICAAKGLGFFGMMGGGEGPGGKSGSGLGTISLEYRDLVANYRDGFQPLKMERVKGASRTLVMQVKTIEKKELPAAMFEIPAGFQEFKMGEMMKGRMPKMPVKPPR